MKFPIPILGRLDVSWEAVTLDARQRPDYAAAVSRIPIRGFPLPGAPGGERQGVEVLPQGLVLPGFGNHYLIGGFGVVKLAAIDPASSEAERAVALLRFVSETSWHSGVDNRLFDGHAQKSVRSLDRVLEKLFFSDQPLGLKCGDLADLLAFLLWREGIRTRRIATTGGNIHHVLLEAHIAAENRWILLDPDFGTLVHQDGRAIGGAEIAAAIRAGNIDGIVPAPIALKAIPAPGFNYSSGFSGQASWSPALSVPQAPTFFEAYRSKVLAQGFAETSRADYAFGDDASGRWLKRLRREAVQ